MGGKGPTMQIKLRGEIKFIGYPIFHGSNSQIDMWGMNYRTQFAL